MFSLNKKIKTFKVGKFRNKGLQNASLSHNDLNLQVKKKHCFLQENAQIIDYYSNDLNIQISNNDNLRLKSPDLCLLERFSCIHLSSFQFN